MFTLLFYTPAQPHDRAPSVSSDSGLSSNSLWTGGPSAGVQTSHSPEDRTQLERATAGGNMEDKQPSLEVMTRELHVNGGTSTTERETDILDDGDGPLTNSTAVIVSDSKEAGHELPALLSKDAEDGVCHGSDEPYCLGVNSTPIHSHTTVSSGFQTHIWVRQQHLVSADSYVYPSSDRLEQRVEVGLETGRSNSTLPTTGTPEVELEAEKDDEFASLAMDIDQSIEQLNQLILDLDPEFEPVPTRARGHMIHSASLHTNGIGHSTGQAKSNQSGKIPHVVLHIIIV